MGANLFGALIGTAISGLLGKAAAGGSGRNDRLQTIASNLASRDQAEKAAIQQTQSAAKEEAAANESVMRTLKFRRGNALLQFSGEDGVGGLPAKTTLG